MGAKRGKSRDFLGKPWFLALPNIFWEIPKDFWEIPKDFRETPKDFRETPKGFRETPKGFRETPKGFRETPKGFRETPKGFRETPKDSGETPSAVLESPNGVRGRLFPAAPFLLPRRAELPQTGRMNGETQAGPERDSRGAVWVWLCWLAGAVILYVLSTGPVLILEDRGVISPGGPASGVIRSFYSPVRWAMGETLLRKPLGMYWHLWAPKQFDSKGN